MDATSLSTIVNPSTAFHDRNRPLSKNSGHCLETHTGSHLEDEDTDSGPLQQSQVTVWKMMQDLSWKMLIQLWSSTMVRNSNTQNPFGIIRSYRRVNLYRERMNR